MEELINSELYQKAVQEIKDKTKIGVDSRYGGVFENLDNQRLAKAHLTTADIQNILETDYSNAISFSISKLAKLHNAKIEEEYPVEEDVEKEEDNAVYGNYSISFLLVNLVEYYLLKYKQTELLNYLKVSRIPNAKKYEDELKGFYSNL